MRSRRRVLRRAVLTLIGVLAAALVWAAVALLSAQADLRVAESALRHAAGAEDLGELQEDLRDAERRLRRADERLSAPGPVVASWIPLLGRTPSAVRTTVRATLLATSSGRQVLAVATRDGLFRDGAVDLDALGELEQVLQQAATSTAGPSAELRDAPTTLVPGRVARGVREAKERLRDLPVRLDRAAGATGSVRRLLGADGPRELLLVLENNAELRGTGGLVSVFARVRAERGRLSFGDFEDVDAVAQPRESAQEVPAPEDYRALWGAYKANTTLWKNVNMSPDIPTSSSVLAALAERSLRLRPDGIVWLDVRTIAAVLGATGDARLSDGTLLTADSTVPELLSQAYLEVADTERDQGLRRLRLRAAADVVVERLSTGSPDVRALGPALARMAAGRHLAVWAAQREDQQGLDDAGVSGRLDGESVDLVSPAVNNFGDAVSFGNKLDYYARRQVTVEVRLHRDEAVVEQRLALRNTAPSGGLPSYVAGRADPGTTNNHVTLTLPAAARDVSFVREDQPLPVQRLRQGAHVVVVDAVSLPPGTTATWRLRYRVPLRRAGYSLRLVPQPLAVDAGVAVRLVAASGRELRVDGAPGDWARDGDALVLSSAFDRVRDLRLSTQAPSLPGRVVERLRRFWNEPVPLP